MENYPTLEVEAATLPGRVKRVLVVDDQDETALVLQRALSRFGHEVELARDGVEALAKLRLEVDLVFLDAEMPRMDGFEVARRIRIDPDLRGKGGRRGWGGGGGGG